MPQIVVETDTPGKLHGREVHRERICPADLQTDTSSHLLVERIGWAVHDAEEQTEPETEELKPQPDKQS